MSTRGLGFSETLSFNGTNFDVWVIRMLNLFRVMDPNLERIVDMGFSPPIHSYYPKNITAKKTIGAVNSMLSKRSKIPP